MSPLIKYIGSCHCESVKFEVFAPADLQVSVCSCSLCHKKQIPHFTVSASNFKLLSGHIELTTYTFGTHQAKHLFCSKCGIQSFFIPKSSHEKMAIVTNCIDSPLPLKMTISSCDPKNVDDPVQNSTTDLNNTTTHNIHL